MERRRSVWGGGLWVWFPAGEKDALKSCLEKCLRVITNYIFRLPLLHSKTLIYVLYLQKLTYRLLNNINPHNVIKHAGDSIKEDNFLEKLIQVFTIHLPLADHQVRAKMVANTSGRKVIVRINTRRMLCWLIQRAEREGKIDRGDASCVFMTSRHQWQPISYKDYQKKISLWTNSIQFHWCIPTLCTKTLSSHPDCKQVNTWFTQNDHRWRRVYMRHDHRTKKLCINLRTKNDDVVLNPRKAAWTWV